MSSRILRRLQEEDKAGDINNSKDLSDTEENLHVCDHSGTRRKIFPANPFDVLIKHTSSESDAKEENDGIDSLGESGRYSQGSAREDRPRRKKKKKRKRCGKDRNLRQSSSQEEETDADDSEDTSAEKILIRETENKNVRFRTSKECDKNMKPLCDIKLKNLNANNELKKMFGSKVIECNKKLRNRGRVPFKNLWLVNSKENWPLLSKTGISMRVERINGICRFTYVHSNDYKDIQRRFLHAMSYNQENITAIIQSYPYHVDALIQLSELYKLTDDLQTAADLIERALYCLESAFHPMFNMARGICNLDYRYQQNRALFICLFKHLTFVGQRACYQTALELAKLLLSLDFDLDPLAIVLCVDFYALRSRNYTWLITKADEWEKKKNLSQLPNFAFSIALAHFRLAEMQEPHDFTHADKLLQDALISFPGILNLLLDKCSVRVDDITSQHPFFNSYVESNHSRPLTQLITLYVHRNYHEWKSLDVIQWVQRNTRDVMRRVDFGDPFVQECLRRRQQNYSFTPRNVLRHIILSDIKEVTATIGRNFPTPVFSFDPVPPLDSIDLYSYAEFEHFERPQNITSLFFMSLLPNFHVNNAQQTEENLIEEEAEDLLQLPVARERGTIGQTVREGVRVLLDAIESIVVGTSENTESDEDAQQNEN